MTLPTCPLLVQVLLLRRRWPVAVLLLPVAELSLLLPRWATGGPSNAATKLKEKVCRQARGTGRLGVCGPMHMFSM